MADNVISNLSIVVNTNADEVAGKFRRLTSAVNGLGSAASSAGGGMETAAEGAEDMGMATQEAGESAGKAAPRIREAGRAARDAGKDAKSGSTGIGHFWQSLKRVAYMRTLRWIVKSIANAFKEGAQNLYQWSAANPQLSDFKRNMDRIATSVLYLKNSLGALLEPIVRILTPIIEWVIDGIVEIINWINKLFAALSGSQTYTVAKKVATTWGDAAEDVASSADHAAGSTHDMAEEIKRTILGFDEINKLEKENAASWGGNSHSGGGNGNTGPNYNDMFEERQLDGWMAVLAKFINDVKTNIPPLVQSLVSPFESLAGVIDGIVETTKGWMGDLGELGKTVLEIPVSLVRSGWTTLKSWVTSFGAAVVDVAVSLTGAGALWSGLQNAWDAIGEKALSVGISVSTTASSLWKSLQKAWGDATDHVLSVTASIATTATSLWTSLQTSWGSIPNHVLSVYLDLATKASTLWTDLQTAWGSIPNHVLNVYLDLATKASTLWTNLQTAWGSIPNHVLNVYLDLATKASTLWTNLETAWGSIPNHVLNVYLDLATKASTLWTNLQTAWGSIPNHVLNVYLGLATKATDLWTNLQTAWGSITNKALSVYLDLATSAQSLWTKLQTAWGSIPNHVLNVYLSVVTGVEDLWKDLQTAWGDAKQHVLDVAISAAEDIKTAVSDVWGWVQENWEVLAAGALGIAIAIATPWETIAAALGTLWANVLGSFGGALSFGVTPKVLKTPQEIKDELDGLKKPLIDLITQPFKIKIEATPGKGFGSIDSDGKWRISDIHNHGVTIDAAAGTGMTLNNNKLAVNYGTLNSSGTVNVNGVAGDGIVFSNTNHHYTLAGVDNASATVNVSGATDGKTGLGMSSGSFMLKKVAGTSSTVSVSGSPVANAGLKLTKSKGFALVIKAAKATVKASATVIKNKGLKMSKGQITPDTKGSTASVTAKVNTGKSDSAAVNALTAGSVTKGVNLSITAQTGGASGLPGDVGVQDFGAQAIDSATSSLVAFLNVFNQLGKNDTKNLKVKVTDSNTLDNETKRALDWKSGDTKSLNMSIGLKSINSTVQLALNGIGKTLTGVIEYTIEVAKKSVSWLGSALASFFQPKKALGGVFSNGMWSSIPQYAGGTTNAHGSLFLAGEAGPEVVGHVGGRTEVLNRSQLAATMYSAVRSAMSGITLDANFYTGGGNEESDYDVMYQAMYDALSAVMARGEERDREKVALLRSINEKDFQPEITASSIAQGMTRMNRRAGTTVVPVGT